MAQRHLNEYCLTCLDLNAAKLSDYIQTHKYVGMYVRLGQQIWVFCRVGVLLRNGVGNTF